MQIYPADLLEDSSFRLALEGVYRKEQQMNTAAAGVVIFIASKFGTDLRLNPQLFAQLANQRLLRSFAGFHFAPGKLPLQRMSIAFRLCPTSTRPSR